MIFLYWAEIYNFEFYVDIVYAIVLIIMLVLLKWQDDIGLLNDQEKQNKNILPLL